jgi:hypothetical protein
MLDDKLQLTAQSVHLEAEAGQVVLYGYADEGEGGPPRLYVVLPNGERRELTPPPAGPLPSVRLTTPLVGPFISRTLTWGEPVAVCVGAADRDVAPGATVYVGWRSARQSVATWAEVALLVEAAPADFGFGNTPLRRIGWADASQQIMGVSDVAAGVVVPGGIPRGSTLYVGLIAQGSGTPPAVIGSPYPDPIGSGAVLRLPSALGWRPSLETMAQVWEAFAGTLPICAAVRLP